MISKKYLISSIYISLLLCLIISTEVLSNISQNTRIYVLVTLIDNTPLANANVKVCVGWSTICGINRTDANGLAIIELKQTSSELRIYVEYSIYSEIYYKRVTYSGENNIYLTIPFKKLTINCSVTNEYLELINGTYSLFFRNTLISTSVFHGRIHINETFNQNELLLINTRKPLENVNERVVGLHYDLAIYVDREQFIYRISYDNANLDKIILDLREPVINVLNKSAYPLVEQAFLISRITIYFSVSDGLNTDRLRVEAFYKWENGEENQRIPKLVESNGFTSCYKLEFDVFLRREYENQLLIVKIKVVDLLNRVSEVTEYFDVWSNVRKSIDSEQSSDSDGNSLKQQLRKNTNEEYVNTTTSILPDNLSGFEIIVDSNNLSFSYIYLIGLVLSIIVLVIEFKRYRRERGSS